MTLDDVKARIRPGAQLVVVANTLRPHGAGELRTVDQVDRGGFWFRVAADDPARWRGWSSWPEGVQFFGPDEFEFRYLEAGFQLRLRFVGEGRALPTAHSIPCRLEVLAVTRQEAIEKAWDFARRNSLGDVVVDAVLAFDG
jgi:hypothetical protein